MSWSKDASELTTVWSRLRYRFTPKRWANGKRYFYEHGGHGAWPTSGWVFSVAFGPGAGYVSWSADRTKVLVHGRTLQVGWRTGSRAWQKRYGWRAGTKRLWSPLEVSFTKNSRPMYLSH